MEGHPACGTDTEILACGQNDDLGRGALRELFVAEEEGLDFEPVVDAAEAGDGGVVGCVVEDSPADGSGRFALGSTLFVPRMLPPIAILEAAELAGVVVDEVVGAEDGLVAAEDDVGGWDGGEVALQPAVLGVEGGGDLHSGTGDEDFEVLLEAAEDALRVGHDIEDVEEVVGAEILLEAGMAVDGDDVPDPLAAQIGLGDVALVVAVVAGEVLGDGVGDDLIHVDADAFENSVHGSIICDRFEVQGSRFEVERQMRGSLHCARRAPVGMTARTDNGKGKSRFPSHPNEQVRSLGTPASGMTNKSDNDYSEGRMGAGMDSECTGLG